MAKLFNFKGKVNYKDALMKAGGLTGGAWLANAAVKIVPATVDPKYIAVGQLVGGIVISTFMGKGNPLIAGVGDGATAIGGYSLIQQLTEKGAATSGFDNFYHGDYQETAQESNLR